VEYPTARHGGVYGIYMIETTRAGGQPVLVGLTRRLELGMARGRASSHKASVDHR